MDEEFRICGKTSSILSQILQNLRRLNWVLEMAIGFVEKEKNPIVG